MKSLVHNRPMVYLRLFFVASTQIHKIFYMSPSIPSGKVAPIFYPLLCYLLYDKKKNEYLAHNHVIATVYSLQSKHKAVNG